MTVLEHQIATGLIWTCFDKFWVPWFPACGRRSKVPPMASAALAWVARFTMRATKSWQHVAITWEHTIFGLDIHYLIIYIYNVYIYIVSFSSVPATKLFWDAWILLFARQDVALPTLGSGKWTTSCKSITMPSCQHLNQVPVAFILMLAWSIGFLATAFGPCGRPWATCSGHP